MITKFEAEKSLGKLFMWKFGEYYTCIIHCTPYACMRVNNEFTLIIAWLPNDESCEFRLDCVRTTHSGERPRNGQNWNRAQVRFLPLPFARRPKLMLTLKFRLFRDIQFQFVYVYLIKSVGRPCRVRVRAYQLTGLWLVIEYMDAVDSILLLFHIQTILGLMA